MDMDLQTINSTNANAKNYFNASSQKNKTTKVRAKTEETIKKQQQMKTEAYRQLENELKIADEQRQRIDAEKYLKKIIKITDNLNRKLKYSLDRELDQIVVKVVDAETDKVIKELPPEELKRLYVKMKEAIGSIVDTLI